jgi:hypothetical protein
VGDQPQSTILRQPEGDSRDLVVRVVAGRIFKRSPRQRELLEYLAARAFAVPPEETHEQDIGMAVFGRPAGYDTSQDNIVRVHASELRKKLEEYFKTDGRDERLILEIPRGGYTLQVRTRPPEIDAAPVPLPPPAQPVATGRRWTLAHSLSLAVVILAVACLYLVARDIQIHRAATAPVVQANPLWRQFFGGSGEADVIVADSCLSLFTDMVGAPIHLQEYVNRSYLLGSIGSEKDPERRRALELVMTRRYTSMADVLTVQRISSQCALDRKAVSVYFARDYPTQRLSSMNVIMLGSKRSNPWVEAFEPKMNFRLEYDGGSGDNRVVNLHPRPGESPSYTIAGGTQDPSESLAIIAYVPNAAGTHAAIVLAGTGLQGTTAAGEAFVSASFQKIADALPRSPGGRVPYFEALLRTESVGSAVQNFSVAAVRLIDGGPTTHASH